MQPEFHIRPPDRTNASQEKNILSKDSLLQLTKSFAKLIPKGVTTLDEEAIQHVRSIHQGLLQTCRSTGLSQKHGAAALNALCGILEQCSNSSVPQIRDICVHHTAWDEAFHIFLHKSDSEKAKPVRRLLLILTQILSKNIDEETRLIIIQHVVTVTTDAICKEQIVAPVRPSIQALELFLDKDLVHARDIIETVARRREEFWAIESPSQPHDDRIDCSPPTSIEPAEDFILCVLEWVQYPDCAPVAGRFLATFHKSLTSMKIETVASRDDKKAFWISAIKTSLKRRPSLLETFEHYVLPNLLGLNVVDRDAFKEVLPFSNILRGEIGGLDTMDIHLCLLVSKIIASADQKDLSVDDLTKLPLRRDLPDARLLEGNARPYNVANLSELPINSELLGFNLLEHATSSVRIAALSSLISHSSLNTPFSIRLLDRLRVCLPFFHVEVNPKSRNEFIALMRRFCTRLKSSTFFLLRRKQGTPESTNSMGNNTEDSRTGDMQESVDVKASLNSHLAFRRWYMMFLLDELRPTSSYQSHITALCILKLLSESELAGLMSMSKVDFEYFCALDDDLSFVSYLRPLFDLLMDPFDDVRQMAAEVLEVNLKAIVVPPFRSENSPPQIKLCHGMNSITRAALERAESTAARIGRADYADGVGRLYNLLYSTSLVIDKTTAWHDCNFLIVERVISALEKEAKEASSNLVLAIKIPSLHGHLIALRYVRGDRLTMVLGVAAETILGIFAAAPTTSKLFK